MRLHPRAIRWSLPIITACALAAVYVHFAMQSRRVGLDLWADLVTGLSQASIVTGPIACGVCALIASRWAQPAAARLPTSARPQVLVRLRHAAGVVLPIAAAFPLAFTVLALSGAVTGTYGAPAASWMFAVGAALTAACCFGYAVGIVAGPRWYTAPAAVLAFFGIYVLLQVLPLSTGVRSLYPVILNGDTEFARHIDETMWSQTLLFLAASLLLLLLAAPRGVRSGRAPIMGAVPIATAAILAASVVLSTNGQYLTGYNWRDFDCQGIQPEICLNRGYADAHAPLALLMQDFEARASGTDLVPTLLEQNLEGTGDAPAPGARSIYLEGIDDEGLRFALSRYVERYGGFAACGLDANFEQTAAVLIVDTWLSGFDAYGLEEWDDTVPGGPEWARFSQLDAAEGNTWLREHQDAYRSCALTFADLP